MTNVVTCIDNNNAYICTTFKKNIIFNLFVKYILKPDQIYEEKSNWKHMATTSGLLNLLNMLNIFQII